MRARELVESFTEDAASQAYDEALGTAFNAAVERLRIGAKLPDAILHGVQTARKQHNVHVGFDELHREIITAEWNK